MIFRRIWQTKPSFRSFIITACLVLAWWGFSTPSSRTRHLVGAFIVVAAIHFYLWCYRLWPDTMYQSLQPQRHAELTWEQRLRAAYVELFEKTESVLNNTEPRPQGDWGDGDHQWTLQRDEITELATLRKYLHDLRILHPTLIAPQETKQRVRQGQVAYIHKGGKQPSSPPPPPKMQTTLPKAPTTSGRGAHQGTDGPLI